MIDKESVSEDLDHANSMLKSLLNDLVKAGEVGYYTRLRPIITDIDNLSRDIYADWDEE